MADNPEQRSARLNEWRGVQRQELRNMIKAEQLLADLENIRAQAQGPKKLSPAKVGALKLAADIACKLLTKVLPDVKAVEHDPGEHTEQLAREQLNLRIAELYALATSRLNGSGGAGTLQAPESGPTTH